MNNVKNPFLLYGYVSPVYFCDRESETAEIIAALQNGRHVTLMSPRRMGKTGLIHNVFYHIQQQEKAAACFYLDIFSTRSLQDFVAMMGRCIVGKLDTPAQRAAGFVSQFFKSTRLVFSTDALTNLPQVSLDFRPEDTVNTLEEIFTYLKQSNRECYIAIDEFQQILEYEDDSVEALLRSYIQFCPNVHFIFSGSKQHLMTDIFSSAKRPFYQSTQKMTLAALDREKYYVFARDHIQAAGKVLTEELFSYIYDMFAGHTWYMQYTLNFLFDTNATVITKEDVSQVLLKILEQEESSFAAELDRLTNNQMRLLVAVAKEGLVPAINAGTFVRKHGLKGTSSINKALEYLIDKELVYKSAEGYCVYNRFFSLWLSRM